MPVNIKYAGRAGNKLFQYVAARIFSEKNFLNLVTSYDEDLIETTPQKNFVQDIHNGVEIIMNHTKFIEDELIFEGYNKNYVFDDYFHNGNFMSNNEELIKSFFIHPENEKNVDDIVMHLRLSDYLHFTDVENPTSWDSSEVISPNYYLDILEKENYKNLYIVVDSIKYEWEKRYLTLFEKFNPILISNSPKEDFNFIMKFDKIICSNSTFCYWSAFFSDAQKIYTFANSGYFGKNMTKIGGHVKNLDNVKNKSISINESFYHEF